MSSQTLYRKYRPQHFTDLIGQPHVALTLLSELQRKQVSHAYLFSGPRGVGKTTTARLLAKAVNCLNQKSGEPDNECEACKAINENRSLDILEIDAASYTGVDNVREIIEHSRFSPSSLKYKVFIIDEVHMLSTAAFNALLKTLEEPPAHAIFILATTEIHKVPETIQSRCQKFNFRRIAAEELMIRLRLLAKNEKISVDDNVIESIARLADGSSRDAESILGQILSIGDKHITLEQASIVLPRSNAEAVTALVSRILQNDRASALQTLSVQVENGIDLEAFRNDILHLLRDCMIYYFAPQNAKPTLPNILTEELKKIPAVRIIQTLHAFLEIQRYIALTPIPQLPMEMAIVESTNENETVSINHEATPQIPPSPVANKKDIKVTRNDSSGTSEQLWQEIVKSVISKEPSLTVSLQAAILESADKTMVIIGSPFALHADRLQTPKAKTALSQTCYEILGYKVKVEVQHNPNLTLDAKPMIQHNTQTQNENKKSPQTNSNGTSEQLWDQIVNAVNS